MSDGISPGRRAWLIAGGVAAIAGGLALAMFGTAADDNCKAQDAAVRELVDRAARDRITARVDETSDPLTIARWEFVERQLDARAQQWVAANLALCRQGESVGPHRCLDAQRAEWGVLMDTLNNADAAGFAAVTDALASQRPPATCLGAKDEHPRAPNTEPLWAALAEARAHERLGHSKQALEQIDAVHRDARANGTRSLEAAALTRRGALLAALGRHPEARAMLEQGYRLAVEVGDDATAAEAAAGLVARLTTDTPEAQAKQVIGDAEAAAARVDAGAEGRLANHVGTYHYRRHDLSAAQKAFVLALAKLQSNGDCGVDCADALSNLALVARRAGQDDEAHALQLRALETQTEVFGPGHPRLAVAHIALGSDAFLDGDLAKAKSHFRSALDVTRESDEHYNSQAVALAWIARVHWRTGDLDVAHASGKEALRLAESGIQDAEALGGALVMTARSDIEDGRLESAATRLMRVLSLYPERDTSRPRIEAIIRLVEVTAHQGDLQARAQWIAEFDALPRSATRHHEADIEPFRR